MRAPTRLGPFALPVPWVHVAPFPAEEVTSRNEAEADPREGGLERRQIEAIWASVVRLYESGLQPAISLAIRRRGKLVLDRAIGHLRGNAPTDAPSAPKVRAKHDSLFGLYSGSKAVTAMLVHLCDERRLLHLDDPVCEYIPGFERHGKGDITLRQLLTHRAGLDSLPGVTPTVEMLADWDGMIALLSDARPQSVPGRRLAYHALTSGFVLGDVVQRVTGKPLRTLLRTEVLDPLGFRTFDYGVAEDRLGDVAENAYTGLPPLPPASWMLERSIGLPIRDAVAVSNRREFLTSVVPSGNVIGTAEEGSRFFELLLRGGELGGVRVFERRTVRRAIAETSHLELDGTLGMPVRYGSGFMLGRESFGLFGPGTPRAFGHLGFTNVIAWADPDRDLSVCLMTSGKPFITPGQLHWLAVPRTIARECPLAG